MYKGTGVYKKTEILEMWEKFCQEIEKREREWDIKIIDYILSNQKKKKIFCDINHITSETAYEIADRILKYLGYDKQEIFVIPMLDSLEVFLYADVKEALELEFEEEYIRKWGHSCCLQTYAMNKDEYVEQLCEFTKFCMIKK